MWKNACVPHLCSERVCLCNKKTKKAREMRKFVNLIASHTTHTPFFCYLRKFNFLLWLIITAYNNNNVLREIAFI